MTTRTHINFGGHSLRFCGRDAKPEDDWTMVELQQQLSIEPNFIDEHPWCKQCKDIYNIKHALNGKSLWTPKLK